MTRYQMSAIMADPLATAEELSWARDRGESRAVFAHPNCPQEVWWKLASYFPMEAPETPAGALFLLAEPDRWAQMETDCLEQWIEDGILQLNLSRQQFFAADLTEMVLPLFESLMPNDPRPRNTLGARRQFATYKIDGWALDVVLQASRAAMKDVFFGGDGAVPARTVASLAGTLEAGDVAKSARRAMALTDPWETDKLEGARKQWRLLQEHLMTRRDY